MTMMMMNRRRRQWRWSKRRCQDENHKSGRYACLILIIWYNLVMNNNMRVVTIPIDHITSNLSIYINTTRRELSFQGLSIDGWIVPAAPSHQSNPSVVVTRPKSEEVDEREVNGDRRWSINAHAEPLICVWKWRKRDTRTHACANYRGRDSAFGRQPHEYYTSALLKIMSRAVLTTKLTVWWNLILIYLT